MSSPLSTHALVIPCYNERGRAEAFIRCLLDTCPDMLLVTVDDGSAAPLGPSIGSRWTALSYPNNRGKGHAVRHGWDWIRNQHPDIAVVGFCDADGAVSAGEIKRLYDLFVMSDCDLLAGSRVCMLGRRVERQLLRHYVGRIYATLVSLMLQIHAYDTQCGCKWLRSRAYDAVAGELVIDRFAFDVELIVRLLRRGFSVREEPVDWQEIPGSKVHLLRDSWRMMRDLRALQRSLHGS